MNDFAIALLPPGLTVPVIMYNQVIQIIVVLKSWTTTNATEGLIS